MGDDVKKLSFSKAYERLREITDELNSGQEVGPSELIALLEEGKGLEKALREHLEQVAGRVEAIEKGEGIGRYVIDGTSTASVPKKKPTSNVKTDIADNKPKDKQDPADNSGMSWGI